MRLLSKWYCTLLACKALIDTLHFFDPKQSSLCSFSLKKLQLSNYIHNIHEQCSDESASIGCLWCKYLWIPLQTHTIMNQCQRIDECNIMIQTGIYCWNLHQTKKWKTTIFFMFATSALCLNIPLMTIYFWLWHHPLHHKSVNVSVVSI